VRTQKPPPIPRHSFALRLAASRSKLDAARSDLELLLQAGPVLVSALLILPFFIALLHVLQLDPKVTLHEPGHKRGGNTRELCACIQILFPQEPFHFFMF